MLALRSKPGRISPVRPRETSFTDLNWGRKAIIQASFHTADNALALEFDATPWFQEADPQSILHLAKQAWSSVWVADALETRPSYEKLHQLIEYAATRLRDESLEDPTWASLECIVNEPEARRWLADNRPEIASLL
jgi:hypothetical protein